MFKKLADKFREARAAERAEEEAEKQREANDPAYALRKAQLQRRLGIIALAAGSLSTLLAYSMVTTDVRQKEAVTDLLNQQKDQIITEKLAPACTIHIMQDTRAGASDQAVNECATKRFNDIVETTRSIANINIFTSITITLLCMQLAAIGGVQLTVANRKLKNINSPKA